MDFAEKHLRERGWSRGKGLGRRENGISEALKVKVKCDTAGVGHHAGEQFSFHWWDHIFNKAASNITVETKQDGVEVKKVTEKEELSVTNKKPRKAQLCKSLLYGRFIKAATLMPTSEEPLVRSESSDDSDSDADEKLDLSSATRLTDEELVRACGGRTGHKGARHGVTMSAKLIRLEEQERQFLAKYGQGRQSGTAPREAEGEALAAGGTATEVKAKRRKKKRASSEREVDGAGSERRERKYKGDVGGVSQAEGRARLGGEPDAEVPGAGEWQSVPERGSKGREKKQKRKRRNRQIAAQLPQNESDLECGNVAKRKKKRRSEVE